MARTKHAGLLCIALLLSATAIASDSKHGERHNPLHIRRPSPQGGNEAQEGSFRVERIKNPSFVRNGLAAKNKALKKFGLEAKETNGLFPRQQTGVVAATPEADDSEYLCPVSIGGQQLMIDLDSGSADFWVFSDYLDSTDAAGHTIYNSTQSSTFSLLPGYNFSILYGDGSGTRGMVGMDKVVVGGATATSAAIELATALTPNFDRDVAMSGIMGVGFSIINNVQPIQQKTTFDDLIPSLARPVISADLREDGSGSYHFGSIPSDAYIGSEADLTSLPVFPGDGYWEFISPFYSINGTIRYNLRTNCSATAPCTGGNTAIADTGTSLLIVDPGVAADYYSNIPGAQDNKATYGGWVFPSNLSASELPSFGVSMGDTIVTVPTGLMCYSYADNAEQYCYGAVQDNIAGNGQSLGVQIYGDVMFRSAFVVFVNDTVNPSLLIGEKAHY